MKNYHIFPWFSYLVAHPTNRKWVATLVINGISGGKSSTYNWGELTHWRFVGSSPASMAFFPHDNHFHKPYNSMVFPWLSHGFPMAFPMSLLTSAVQLWRLLEQHCLSALRMAMRLLRHRSVLVASFGLEAGKEGILRGNHGNIQENRWKW